MCACVRVCSQKYFLELQSIIRFLTFIVLSFIIFLCLSASFNPSVIFIFIFSFFLLAHFTLFQLDIIQRSRDLVHIIPFIFIFHSLVSCVQGNNSLKNAASKYSNLSNSSDSDCCVWSMQHVGGYSIRVCVCVCVYM